MIDYNYTTRIDPDDGLEYACYTEGDNYYEVLKIAEESELDLLLKIDAALLLTEMNKLRITQIRDDVYVNAGTLVRQDYTIGQSQGAALVNQLQSAFPDHANWNRSILNIVGSYGAYREPYTNNSISWYDFGTTPSTELCTSYGVTKTADNSSNFKEWYGLKFDLLWKNFADLNCSFAAAFFFLLAKWPDTHKDFDLPKMLLGRLGQSEVGQVVLNFLRQICGKTVQTYFICLCHLLRSNINYSYSYC